MTGWLLRLAPVLGIGALAVLLQASALGAAPSAKPDRVVRVALLGVDMGTVDPALSYTPASGALVDATCARLVDYARSGPLHLVPEVATGFPRVSLDRRTYVFTLRSGFRFSDGAPVRADAFEHAIDRILAPKVASDWAKYMRDIVGADRVLAGKATSATGVVARGNTLTVRLTHPAPDFTARAAFLCAVPPTLPPDPEGAGAYAAAGPYSITEYVPGVKVELRRNPFYGGKRPRRVDGFTVDLTPASYDEILDRIERNEVDWGYALADAYFDPPRRFAAKYGVNRSRFFVDPGFEFRGYMLNSARPLFANNPELRRAVNFAVDRRRIVRLFGGTVAVQPTDQYLPPRMPGFRDADIYPLTGPDLARARALARGHTRGGKAVLWTPDRPVLLAAAQGIKEDLAKIGLDVEIKGLPRNAYIGPLGAKGAYDIGFMPWIPDYLDPYAVLNVLFDGRFIGSTNWARFDSPGYNGLLRRASLLQGGGRYRTYGALDVRLAREQAPAVAIGFLNQPTLVSSRIDCVSRPFDLSAVCLK